MIRHAGLIAMRRGGFWRGVLIEAASGAGKSDLALRALDAGFRLVADDRVELWVSGGRLFGAAPAALHGLIEARGVGNLSAPALPLAEVALVAAAGAPERIPAPETAEILRVTVPRVEISLTEASAPAKLSRAMETFDAAHKRRI